ncbi:MAG: hypothetical protein M3O62_18335 [Pseudomonadota bacterium]|nr:hypothetical protein [Pseudomonadota bacterium]
MIAAALILPVTAVLLLSGSALFSSINSNLADSALNGVRWRFDVLERAKSAVAWAPWRSAPRMQTAQILTTIYEMDAAVLAASAALQSAPADALQWVYWARLRGASDQYDNSLLHGYRLAVSLAPNAWNVRESIALDGVMRWRHGDEGLRQVWTESINYALYRRRKEFSREIVRYGRDPYFCATVGERLPLKDWCALAKRARAVCADEKIKPAGIAWCQGRGFPTRYDPR